MRGVTGEQSPQHGAWGREFQEAIPKGVKEGTTGVLESDGLQQKEFYSSIRDFGELEKSNKRGKMLHRQKISQNIT